MYGRTLNFYLDGQNYVLWEGLTETQKIEIKKQIRKLVKREIRKYHILNEAKLI